VVLAALACGFFAPAVRAAGVPAFKHVMVVIFENQDVGPTERQPFFARLAKQGALFTDFHAEAHPSQPNYIALTSGNTQGVTSDGKVDLDARNVADLVEAKGKTWKVYVEDWPGDCYAGSTKGRYARKHNPFISYTDISSDATRCANIVDAGELNDDVAAGALPDYAFYVPNMDDDAHDTNLDYADNWYSTTFGPLLTDPRFSDGMLLVTTFDESTTTEPGNVIYTSMWGDMVKPGSAFGDRSSHYTLLSTIEAGLGLGDLGGTDASTSPATGIWR
jgi:hypothetical protein